MTLAMRDQENQEIGYEKGKIEGALDTLLSLVSQGVITIAQAAKQANMSEEEMEELLAK